MYDLEGKVAFVTGGASGIGNACARELLKNNLKGVAVIDINSNNGKLAVSELCKEFGKDKAIFVKSDVVDKQQLEEAFEVTVKTFKQLDIVFNNAGIVQEIDIDRCISVNLLGVISGTLLAIEKYLPKYKSDHEAVVVNTSSTAGIMPFTATPIYATTKAGIVGFTRSMGGEFRYQQNGIRILAVCPSFTDTPLGVVNESQLLEPHLTRL